MTEPKKVRAYLKRIGLDSVPRPTKENLFVLQKAHMTHVPYESLDIGRGTAGPLTYEELYEKMVVRGRGGYCFELNGLFGWLLKELGYETVEHFGRWLMDEPLEIPARRHRVIRVTFGKTQYIADVGVGQRAPLEPLELVHGKVQVCEDVPYRIVGHERLGHVVEARLDGVWKRIYSFDDAPQEPIDFCYVHYYLVHHPDSFFRSHLFVYLPTAYGRNAITMAPDPESGESVPLLSVSGRGGQTVRTYLRSPARLTEALERHFGIRGA